MKTLISDYELFAAALGQLRVYVYDKATNSIVGYGGPIEKYTDAAVKIGGVYYMRSVYEFRATVA